MVKELETLPVVKVSNYFQRKHSIETHNYYIKIRRIPCPYCNHGSVPVQKKEIEEDMKKYERG